MTGDPLPDWDLGAFASPTPASVVPVPASGHRDLRGQRVIVGLPGHGWRADLRGDAPVVQASRTYVPVLSEQEWYRAEAEQTEVFAPLVPIERVWVEIVEGSGGDGPAARNDLVSRLVSLDAPPRRDPVPVREATVVTGRRVVWVPPPEDKTGPTRRDMRAVTEPYSGSDGDICVRITAELDWYRWAWSGQLPKTREVPVHLLWLE
jgi:hypothetical protein